jgi:hypothetical protein
MDWTHRVQELPSKNIFEEKIEGKIGQTER